MSALFSPIKLKDVTLRNRIGMSPMCQYSAVDGVMNDWHRVHLVSRAVGGAGLIFAEATAVRADGRITAGCLGLWNDAQVAAAASVNRLIVEHGAVPALQIGHSGRKGSAAAPWDGGAHVLESEGGWPIVAPSEDAFDQDGTRLFKAPHQLTTKDIATLQSCFVDTAKRAIDAGYKMLEIHGAHGYLLHSFFTPLVNKRDDHYGGDLRNRARMMLETVEAVRKVWPENLPLAVRLSVSDWTDGGLTIDDNIQMAKWLKERGVDIVDCSGGGATPAARASIGTRTADQVGLGGKIRAEAGIATMAVGCITNPAQADEIIATGTADIALIGRQMMWDPYWAKNAGLALGVDVKSQIPHQYAFYMK